MRITLPASALIAQILLGSIVLVSFADSVSIIPDRDNSIYQESGTASNGAGDTCFVGTNSFGNVRRALMRFDVAAALPSGATINSVTLDVYCSQTNAGNAPSELHRLVANWGEGTSVGLGQGGPATPGDATWTNTFFPSASWLSPGGDYDPTAHGSTTIGFGGFHYTFSSTALMTADVQNWLDHPATNFGWVILGDESTSGSAKRLASRENLVPSQRPSLTIDFTPPVVNLPGDFNHDQILNGTDVNIMVDVLLGLDTDPDHLSIADINQNGSADGTDIAPFVHLFFP